MVDVVVSVGDGVVGFDAGLVDSVAVGGIPVGRGNLEGGATREVEHGLDDAFAVGGFADDGGFVVIFEGAGDDF